VNIVPRDEWCDTPPAGTPPAIRLPAPEVWLHHGASGSSTADTARAYARFHIRDRGYLDVGYSFIIASGRVLEGRGPGVQGAHTATRNAVSHGICIAGDYTSRTPSGADLDALTALLRHGATEGWWPSPELSGGHRDAPGATTRCPGNGLHPLIARINRDAKEDDVALTAEQERALAMIPKLAADIDTIKTNVGSRPNGKALDDLGRLRRTLRAVAAKVGVPADDVDV
jgi:hypothetical protein